MKRFAFGVLGAVSLVLLSVAPALAQSDIPPEVGPGIVTPPVVAPPGGTAFTGSNVDITMWMVIAAALLVLGLVFWIAGKRRGTTPVAAE